MNRLYSTKITWRFLVVGLLMMAFLSGNAQISSAEHNDTRIFRSGLSNPYAFNYGNNNKLYILDASTDKIYEFSGGTKTYPQGYSDVATDEFDVSPYDTSPTCFRFNADGSKMYLLGRNSDKIWYFFLSSSYDISTATHYSTANHDLDISAQTGGAYGMVFADNGNKMYLNDGNTIYEYDLPLAYYTGGAVFNKSYQPKDGTGTGLTFIRAVEFNRNGYRAFVLDDGQNSIFEYELTEPYDLSTATYADQFSVNSYQNTPFDFQWANSFYSVFLTLGTSGDDIDYFTVNAHPFVSSVSDRSSNFNSQEASLYFSFNENVSGVKLNDFTIETTGTATYENVSLRNDRDRYYYLDFAGVSGSGTIQAAVKSSGTNIADASQNPLSGGSPVAVHPVGTSYNLAAFSYSGDSKRLFMGDRSDYEMVVFDNSGTKMFLGNNDSDSIHVYNLATPFVISSATVSDKSDWLYIGEQERNMRDLAFSQDGLKLFVVGTSSDVIHEFNLNSAFDVASATWAGSNETFDFTGQFSNCINMVFGNDGNKLYLVSGVAVIEYSLNTAFDVSTAYFEGASKILDVTDRETSLKSVAIDETGTRLFITGTSSDQVMTYSMSTPYDIASASFEEELTLELDGENATPYDMTFTAAGTKLIVADLNSDYIFEYNSNRAPQLESFELVKKKVKEYGGAFVYDYDLQYHLTFDEPIYNLDISDFTLLRGNNNSYVTEVIGEGSEYDITVDYVHGSGMFGIRLEISDIVDSDGASLNATYQSEPFQVGVDFNVSEAVYEAVYDVGVNESTPYDFEFNDDGSKLFVIGSGDDQIDEYNLSVNFDVTTAVFAGDEEALDVSPQSSNPKAMKFNSNGTRLFVIGGSTVYQYELSEAYDISIATYSGHSFSVSSEESSPYDIEFNSSGTKMFITGTSSDDLHTYNMTYGYSINFAEYAGDEEVLDLGISDPTTFTFDDEGRMLYVSSYRDDLVHAFALSTTFDLKTAVYLGVVFDIKEENNVYSIGFNADGSKFYAMGTSGDDINQYDLQSAQTSVTAFEISDFNYGWSFTFKLVFDGPVTGVDESDFELETSLGVKAEITLNPSGEKLNEYQVTVNQILGDGVFTLSLKDAGTGILDKYGNEVSTSNIRSFSIASGSAYDLSHAEYLGSGEAFSVAGQESSPYDMAFNHDGSKLFVMGISGDDINQYNLSTPYDVSTASYSQVFDTGAELNNPTSFAFNDDGTQLYIYGSVDKIIQRFSLSTAFDVSSISVASFSQRLDVSAEESSPQLIRFNEDGSKLFILGTSSDEISQYSLATAYDVSSATYLGKAEVFSVKDQDSSPKSLAFSVDGYRMVVLGDAGDKLLMYELSEAFDVSTAVQVQSASYDFGSEFTNGQSVMFDNTGLKMYVLESTGDRIHEYDLNKAPEFGSLRFSPNPNISSSSLNLTLRVSEEVTGIDISDLELILDGVTADIDYFEQTSYNTLQYLVRVNNIEGQGTIQLKAKAGAHILDALGKPVAEDVLSEVRSVDRVAPTAQITMDQDALKIGETSAVIITFSEEIVSFDLTNITAPQGTLSSLQTTDNITYTTTFTPATDVSESGLKISVDMTQVVDLAGNISEGTASSADYLVDTKRPDLTITTDLNQLNASATATITFNFSEVVSGFEISDITVENGSLTDLASTDGGMTYTAKFTPDVAVESATNVISVDKSLLTDVAGNVGAGISTSENIQIDTKAPTFEVTMSDEELTIGETAMVTVTFSEPMLSLIELTDIEPTATNGTLSEYAVNSQKDVITMTFTPDVDIESHTSKVQVDASAAVDPLGNSVNSAGTLDNITFTIDNIRPSVAINMDDQELLVGETAEVTFTFREPVIGFSNEDITLENGSLSDVASADAGLTFTATFTPDINVVDATNEIVVSNTAYTDTLGNTGLGTTASANFEINTKIPTVEVSMSDDVLGVDESSVFTFTFSEEVTGFTTDDITVENGALSGFAQTADPVVYEVTFTPTAFIEDYENILSVDNTGFNDLLGNAGVGTTESENFIIDGVMPTVEITVADETLTIGETNEVTITFSEPVLDFTNADFSNIGNGILTDVISEDGGKTFTATFTPTDNLEEYGDLAINNSLYTDRAGNAGQDYAYKFFVIDTKAPTVEIQILDEQITIGEVVNVSINFSESPIDFAIEDLVVENGVISDLRQLKGDNFYSAVLTPNTGVQDLMNEISVAAGALTDRAGNPSLASTSNNFVIDVVAPTAELTIDNGDLLVGETATFTITFSEEVTGFDISDLSIDAGEFSTLETDDNITFTTILTPPADAEIFDLIITINIPGASDLRGNAGTSASTLGPINFDTNIPTATISTDEQALKAGEKTVVTVVFSEEVEDFDDEDITITGGVLTDYYTEDGITYTATFNPDENMEMVNGQVSVDMTDVFDIAGNAGSGTIATELIQIDTKRPTVALEMDDLKLLAGETAHLTITFSEEVVGFELADVFPTNAVISDFQTTDNVIFTALLTPNADVARVNNKVGFNGEAFTDLAGNTALEDAVAYYEINTVIPAITFEQPEDKVYGDDAFSLTASSTSGEPIVFTSSDESVLSISGNTVTIQSAGSATLTATQPATEDHNEGIPVEWTVEVAKTGLTIYADTLEMVYGDPLPELTMHFEGFVYEDLETDIALPVISTTAANESGVGVYQINLEGGSSNNYEITLIEADLTITPAALTATANSYSKLYGEAMPELDITYEGFVHGDSELDITEPEISTEVTESSAVGNYIVTLTGGASENYNLSLFNGKLSVEKTMLSITADDQEKAYGESNPDLTLTYVGFVLGETSQDLLIQPRVSTTADEASVPDTYTIAVSGATSDNYEITETAGTLTIIKADQTVIFEEIADIDLLNTNAVNLIASASTGLDINFELVSGDGVITGTTLTVNATGTYEVKAVQAGNGNYNEVSATRFFNVTDTRKSNQTITFDALMDKTYGDAPFALTATASSGLSISYSVEGSATINGNELEITGAGAVTVTATQSGDDDFNPAPSVAQSFTVSKASLVAIADDATMTYGDEIPTLTVSYSGFVNGDSETDLDELAVASTDAASSSNAGTYEVTVSGGSDDNYELSYQSGTLNIDKADQMITFDALMDKTFGDAAFNVAAVASSDLEVAFSAAGPATLDGNIVSITGAGEVTITATQSGSNNFNAAPEVSRSFTVGKASLVAIADDAMMTYGEEVPTLTVSYSGFVNEDTEADLDLLAMATTDANSDSNVGTYEITVSGGSDHNYELTYQSGTLTIEKANQAISFDALANKTYGDAPFALTAMASSGLAVSYSVSGPATLSGNEVTITGAGEVTIKAAQVGDNNYNTASDVSQSFTVVKAILTATADDATMTYGDEIPTLTVSYSGFVNGDSETDLDELAVASTDAAFSSDAGTYDITVSGGSDDNYELTYQSGMLTIEKADQMITFDALMDKTFGDAAFNVAATASSDLEVAFSVAGPATLDVNIVSITGAGEVTITATQSGSNNYNAAPEVSRSFTVGKASLVAIADDAMMTYGEEVPTLTVSYSGFVNEDTEADLDVLAMASTDANSTSDVGTYEITVSGGNDHNYELTYQSGTLTIEKADQAISFDALVNKTYGDAPFALTATASSGLDVTYSLDGPATLSDSEVIITGAGEVTVTATQTGSNNFNAAPEMSQSFTVGKASLVATADDATMTYGDEIPTLTVSYSGFVYGDTETELDELAVASTDAASSSDVGTYDITVSGGSDDNYELTYQSGTLTIEKANQTIIFDAIEDIDLLNTDQVSLVAVASSGLGVSFELVSGEGSIEDNILTVNSTGTFEVKASQAGNGNYDEASESQTFVVTDSRKADQTITFELPAEIYVTDGPLPLSATSDAGIDVSFEIISGNELASISASELTLIAAGTVEIRVYNEGNDDFKPASATASIEILPVFSLSGMVTADGSAFTSGTATLYNQAEGTQSDVALTTDGSYKFENLKSGEYLVNITPDDADAYYSTAYGDVIILQNATPIMVFSDTIGFDIEMITKSSESLLTGNTTLTGRVIESEDGSSRIEAGRILEGAPLSGVSVLLIRKADDQLMTEAFTDQNGDFEITGIPLGDFSVIINMPGVDGGISWDLNVVSGSEVLMTAIVGEEGISFETSTTILSAENFEYQLYPNPTVRAFVIKTNNESTVQIYDQHGREVLRTKTNQVTDVSRLPDGVFILRLTNAEGRVIKTDKLIKKSR